eukprot:scaffold7310_cov28-Tisochrysis_lutea.AAC.2
MRRAQGSSVEVVDRGGGAPRVEVGTKRRRPDELSDRLKVCGRHLLWHKLIADEQHVPWEQGELVGEDVITTPEKFQVEQAFTRVLDFAEMEARGVERCADEALTVSFLGLGCRRNGEERNDQHGARGKGEWGG